MPNLEGVLLSLLAELGFVKCCNFSVRGFVYFVPKLKRINFLDYSLTEEKILNGINKIDRQKLTEYYKYQHIYEQLILYQYTDKVMHMTSQYKFLFGYWYIYFFG